MEKNKSSPPSVRWLGLLTTRRERESLIENLSTYAASGMGLLEALEAMKEDTRTVHMRRVLDWMKVEIDAGAGLSRVMERTGLFPQHTISLVRMSEEAGSLSQNLHAIGMQQQKERMFRSKIRSAMLYPGFVLGVTAAVGVGIAWFILPKLALVFSQLHIPLPLITKLLILVGTCLDRYGIVAVPTLLGVLVILLYVVFVLKRTKFVGQALCCTIPSMRQLLMEIEMSRFSYLLGTLLKAGLPIVEIIHTIEQATEFRRYQRFYAYLGAHIEDGGTVKQCFQSYRSSRRLIPISIQQRLVAAEEAGSFIEVLHSISQEYEEKIDTSAKNLTVMLEPILLLLVWGGVVCVALAVILPIYQLIGSLNQPLTSMSSAPTFVPVSTSVAVSEPPILPPLALPKSELQERKLQIVSVALGYVNVRDASSVGGRLLTRVKPNEIYVYTQERAGWYYILLPDNTSGWISGTYITLLEHAAEAP